MTSADLLFGEFGERSCFARVVAVNGRASLCLPIPVSAGATSVAACLAYRLPPPPDASKCGFGNANGLRSDGGPPATGFRVPRADPGEHCVVASNHTQGVEPKPLLKPMHLLIAHRLDQNPAAQQVFDYLSSEYRRCLHIVAALCHTGNTLALCRKISCAVTRTEPVS